MPLITNKPKRRLIILIIIILKGILQKAIDADDTSKVTAVNALVLMLETQTDGLMSSTSWNSDQNAAWSKILDIKDAVIDDCSTSTLTTKTGELETLLGAI